MLGGTIFHQLTVKPVCENGRDGNVVANLRDANMLIRTQREPQEESTTLEGLVINLLR